ncbi:universal stress protein [Telluria mixta]|uniref:Universal stress protein n=1 Tax=Telluria mixta TaxID=34071 RepID=A0ABT2BSZ5_9BURK|nr:universal stress protein [Telluria mixta]MCS0628235.1 universal stress protein [Telluria mixta]WEM93651.1 universal stress protein [Telluria mixta]
MNYKTLLVHVDTTPAAPARIRLALGLARAAGAHVVGAAVTGVSHFVTSGMLAAGDSRLAGHCAALRRDAEDAVRRFEDAVRADGPASFESRVVDDDVDGGLAVQARYADLVLVGRTDPAAPAPDGRSDLPDYLLFAGGRPVLIVPHAPGPWRADGEALVAWDGSVPATRAVAAALPLLRAARGTTVVGFGDDADDTAGGDPCARLAAWLGRHGVAARASHRAATDDVGDTLLSAAADMDAGLLVMGAYGHGRLRERCLGGASRTVLAGAPIPVLMAH